MGANMMPTMKKSGRTVFGVRMGLSPRGQCWCSLSMRALHTYCHAFSRCWRNAVSVHASVLLCFSLRAQPRPQSRLTRGPSALGLLGVFAVRVLAGYRVAGLHLLGLRHAGRIRAVPQRRVGGAEVAVVWWVQVPVV